MLRTLFSNLAIIGGIIILSRHLSLVWQIVIGVLLLVVGLIETGLGI